MVLGSKDRIQEIQELLTKDDVTTVILDGNHGVGKTWTARQISMNKDLIRGSQWLYLNKKNVSSSLDNDIARQLSLFSVYEEWEAEDVEEMEEKKKEKSLGNVRERICRKLEELRSAACKENELFLLILDGARHDQDAEEIMSEYNLRADRNGHNSFKLLITRGGSDRRDTEKEIETSHTRVYIVDPLSKEDSSALVGAKLKKEFSDSSASPVVIITIVKGLNCCLNAFGLLSMENFLQDADDDDGKAAISMLVHSLYSNPLSGVQMACFWHSKHFFGSGHAGLHYNELITHWILEGYVRGIDHIEKTYEQGHHVLMQLINCGMLRKYEDNMVTLGGILSSIADLRHSGFHGTASIGLANAFEDDEKWKGLGRLTYSDGMIKSAAGLKPGTKS